jgi:outer membrane protein OmpA-like peptidoglycan-associated protein
MKKLLPLLLLVCASAVMAQATDLKALNDQTGLVQGFKIRNVPLGSGVPSLQQGNVSFETANSLGNGMYTVPGFLPYYPTAATIWPRVVQVRCSADGMCDGYSITPALGRGEYLYVQPIVVPAPIALVQKFTIGTDTLFDFDKATLKAGGKDKLDDLASKVQGANIDITIVGYTDLIGSDAYNIRLSLRRAQAVRAYLIGKGLQGSHITALGKGKLDPIITSCANTQSNAAKACQAPNRRVELQVTGIKQ